MPEDMNQQLVDKLIAQNETIKQLKAKSNQIQPIQLRPITTDKILHLQIKEPSLAALVINHILSVLMLNDRAPSSTDLEQYYGLAMSYLITHTDGNQFMVAYHAHPSYYSVYGFKGNDEIEKTYGLYGPLPILDTPGNDPLGEQVNLPELDKLILMWNEVNWINLVQKQLNPRINRIRQANGKDYQREPVDIAALQALWDDGLTIPMK